MKKILFLLIAFSVIGSLSFAQNNKRYTESKGLKAFNEGELYGFKDSLGNVVVKPQFDAVVGHLAEPLNPVSKNGKFGYIDPKGDVVIPFRWDYAFNFGMYGEPDLAMVNLGGQEWRESAMPVGPIKPGYVGFINRKGEVVIPIKYTFFNHFIDGVAFFSTDKNIRDKKNGACTGRIGLIDKTGRVIVEPKYDKVFDYYANGKYYFVVGLKGKFGALTTEGKDLIELKHKEEEVIELLKAL